MGAKLVSAIGAAALTAVGVTGVATVAGADPSGSASAGWATSRLDEGRQVLPEATITVQQAIDTAQSRGAYRRLTRLRR